MNSLDGKIVIVTGGAGMLGSQYMEAIKEIGGYPISLDLKYNEPFTYQFNSEEAILRCDITNEEEIVGALNQIKNSLTTCNKPIYGLINNAAIDFKLDKSQRNSSPLSLEGYPSDFFDKELSVSLKGAFLCTKHFGSEMVRNSDGSIINISSILGVCGPNQNFYRELGTLKPFGYTVVKHAMIGITRHTATEWGKYNVRCNALVLGGVYNNHPDEFVEKLSKYIPLGRMAEKNEYNSAIKFLLTDDSSFMTGSTLTLDGGQTCW